MERQQLGSSFRYLSFQYSSARQESSDATSAVRIISLGIYHASIHQHVRSHQQQPQQLGSSV